jgi:hypothetical protein
MRDEYRERRMPPAPYPDRRSCVQFGILIGQNLDNAASSGGESILSSSGTSADCSQTGNGVFPGPLWSKWNRLAVVRSAQ